MGPCTAPTFATVPAQESACGCANATESESVPVLVPVLVAVAAFVWARQKWGSRPVLLHLERPEAALPRRTFRWPRLVLSDRERRAVAALRDFFTHPPEQPTPMPIRADMRARPIVG